MVMNAYIMQTPQAKKILEENLSEERLEKEEENTGNKSQDEDEDEDLSEEEEEVVEKKSNKYKK